MQSWGHWLWVLQSPVHNRDDSCCRGHPCFVQAEASPCGLHKLSLTGMYLVQEQRSQKGHHIVLCALPEVLHSMEVSITGGLAHT